LLERHAAADGHPTAPDAVSGDAFNAASAAALAGARVALLTALGRDEGGDRVLAELTRRGIGTEHVHRADRPTGAYTISPDAEGHPQFSYQRAGSAASALDRSALAGWGALIEATPVLLTGGIFGALTGGTRDLLRRAVARANSAGRSACYDVNFRPRLTSAADALELLRAVAPGCRLVKIGSPGDSEPLFGRTATGEVAAAVGELTGAAVVVTAGEEPLALGTTGDPDPGSDPGADQPGRGRHVTHHPGRPAPAFVDATGAGDVLIGTLAARLALGDTLAAALPEAMAAAALSTGRHGGAPHATRAEVRAFLDGTPDPGTRG
jgi:sugar/nucleoside kinase (ribokinase family)